MKKNLFLHLFRQLLVLCLILNSQFSIINCFAQCYPPASTTELSTNNIRALFKTNGTHFNNNGQAQFEVPKGSGKHTIYSASLWVGGMNNNALYLSAVRFGQIGNDFYAGPVSDGGTAPSYYDQFWRVTKEEIEYHRLHYKDPGYVIPSSIAEWPAHGKTEWNESYHLAPYVDVSGNGKYSPELGDYPKIKGDEAIFFILNDGCETHIEEKHPLGVEILCMAYAFDSPNEVLKNTIFLSYTIRNKSNKHYENFYASFFVDFDLGWGWDDYIGCDSTLNLSYVYEIIETGKTQLPVQGAVFLNQKMSSFMYFINTSGPMGDPKNQIEYYNYMSAFWANGVPLTYGGTGYDPASTNYTKFAFPGDLVKGEGWTELTPDGPFSLPNKSDDKRGVMSAGPFSFPAGGTIYLDIALPWASSLSSLINQTHVLQDYYDNYLDISEHTVNSGNLLLYPNPSNGQFTISSELVIESIELYDIMGKKVFSETLKTQTAEITTNLPQGFYMYRATMDNKGVCFGKIVVQQ